MKKLLFLIVLFPIVAFAQAPRDVDVTISYDPAPVGEQVTNYLCQYLLQENGVNGDLIDCGFTADVSNTHVISLLATTADLIAVKIAPCNVNGCEVLPVAFINTNLPPAVDPVTPAVNVIVMAVKI